MSGVSKTTEISLNAEERELLEEAIKKCKEIAKDCINEGVFMDADMIFNCLTDDYISNGGKLSAQIEVYE